LTFDGTRKGERQNESRREQQQSSDFKRLHLEGSPLDAWTKAGPRHSSSYLPTQLRVLDLRSLDLGLDPLAFGWVRATADAEPALNRVSYDKRGIPQSSSDHPTVDIFEASGLYDGLQQMSIKKVMSMTKAPSRSKRALARPRINPSTASIPYEVPALTHPS
jgi:hypothetical protein